MKLFTSEAVCKGHPDKVCDQIADAILDRCYEEDINSHVACEVCCTTGTIILMGEITTNASIDYKEVARNVLKSIGYIDAKYGIDYKSCSVIDLIDKQSSEINNAVFKVNPGSTVEGDIYDTVGAGDQGIIFGYACDETNEYMPLSITLAHKLARKLELCREYSDIPWLRPDGKTQVTVKYDEGNNLIALDTILISAQHDDEVPRAILEKEIIDKVILPVLAENCPELNDSNIKFIINPSGSFTIGGPHGDTGLTGRKLAVDTYGGHAKFGGGAMCGKDPSKVDRSAAYMSRYVAKHIVASGLANTCEVQLSYAIGIPEPVSINVKTTGCIIPDSELVTLIKYLFDFRPLAIIDLLKLYTTKYSKVSGDCQFGNDFMPWEILNKNIINSLKSYKINYMKSYV